MNQRGTCTTGLNNQVEFCTCESRVSMPAISYYRPRGSLARALYEKQIADEYLSTIDKSKWYECNLQNLDESVASRFIQLYPDEDTLQFIQQSEEKSDWILTQIWHSLAKAILGWFMTQTSINGWLQRGSMFVLSFNQFLMLLGCSSSTIKESLLDLGAGDGEVTARISSIYKNVYVTEVSKTMQTLLKNRGFELLPVDSWYENRKFDTICCLNLLDRCEKPLQLLRQIKSALKPDGLLVLAVVLPFSPYVETGTKDHQPKELLPIIGSSFEEEVSSMITTVLKPAGFELLSWSRVPYLCEGDLNQAYYWLDDVIFVLKLKDNN